MLYIKNITLTQFKNYSLAQFAFNKKVTGICGSNGMGKTNILDAIYYCCFTKSYFSRLENNNIQFGTDGCRVEVLFYKDEQPQNLTAIYRGKKELTINGVAYEKLAEHIGQMPCVMICPDDIELVNGSSEIRRKYLDTLICQIDKEYLYTLLMYNKIVQQRNSLLKQLAESKNNDFSLLDVLDEQLTKPCNYIFEIRKKITDQLTPIITNLYKQISNDKERITVQYQSKLQHSSFADLLKQSRQKDLALQRTTCGIHRDDVAVIMNDVEFKVTASQGQKKSLLFALKLAEFEMLTEAKGFAPLLLLDDVFEKLDEERMKQLLHKACNDNDGQVIITDTHYQRLHEAFTNLQIDFSIIDLNTTNG